MITWQETQAVQASTRRESAALRLQRRARVARSLRRRADVARARAQRAQQLLG